MVSHAPRGTDSFVARYDPDGNPVWARQFGGPDSAFSACSELCTDRKGNLYATGYFSGTAAFGTHIILGTALDYHVYLLKYDPSGVLQWVRVNGREGGSNTSTVALHGEDQIFWAGIFARSIEIGDVTVTASSPEHSLFVSRLHLSGQLSARSEAGNLVLDWSTNLTDVILQSAPGLTSPDSWQPVPFPAARSGSRFVLTNSFDRPSRFFRLLSR